MASYSDWVWKYTKMTAGGNPASGPSIMIGRTPWTHRYIRATSDCLRWYETDATKDPKGTLDYSQGLREYAFLLMCDDPLDAAYEFVGVEFREFGSKVPLILLLRPESEDRKQQLIAFLRGVLDNKTKSIVECGLIPLSFAELAKSYSNAKLTEEQGNLGQRSLKEVNNMMSGAVDKFKMLGNYVSRRKSGQPDPMSKTLSNTETLVPPPYNGTDCEAQTDIDLTSLEETLSRVLELEEHLHDVGHKLLDAEAQLKKSEDSVGLLNKKVDLAERELDKEKLRHNEAKKSVDALTSEKEKLKKEVVQLKSSSVSDAASTTRETEKTKRLVEQLQATNSEITKKNSAQELELTEVRQQLNELNSEFSKLKTKVSQLESTASRDEQALRDLQAQYDEMKRQKEKLSQDLSSARAATLNVSDIEAQKDMEIESLQKNIQQYESRIRTFEAKVKSLATEINMHELEKVELHSTVDRMQEMVTKLGEDKKEKLSEIDKLRKSSEEVLENERNTHQKQLEEHQSRAKTLEEKFAKLTSEHSESLLSLDSLKEDKDRLSREMEVIKMDLEAKLQKAMSDAEAELKKAQSTHSQEIKKLNAELA
eukprot:PhF_6_TR7961/c0_g1_i3/m.12066